MRRTVWQGIAAIAITASLLAAPLPELFQKVKQRVSAGDWSGGLEALKELDAEAARPENERARAALRPAAAFYRGVCLAAMDQAVEARAEFALYIAANPDKGIDRNAYPKKVIAAFGEARRRARLEASEEASSLAAAYRALPYSSSASTPPSPEWAQVPSSTFWRRRRFEPSLESRGIPSARNSSRVSGLPEIPLPRPPRTSSGANSNAVSRSPTSTSRKVPRAAA